MKNLCVKRGIPTYGLAFVGLFMASMFAPAHAGSVTIQTPTGATTSGPVDAEAIFTTSDGKLTITLKDLLVNPKDVAQLLSDLSFTVANGTLTGAILASSSGQAVTVNSNKTYTLGSAVPTGWVPTFIGISGKLDDLVGTGHAGPAHLIIGPPDSGTNKYSNANGSITGNGAHNPFLNGSATFTITGAGITANTTITSATFSFGTTEGQYNITVQSVPEPGSLVLGTVGLGLAGAIGLVRSRRRTRVIAS